MTCHSCSMEVAPEARFCAGCGAAVAATSQSLAAKRTAAVSRLKGMSARTAIGATCVAVILAAAATVVTREHARSERLDRTTAALASTRDDLKTTEADLTKSKARGDKLTADLKKSQDRATSLTTQLTGVRGSLKATSSERDVLRTCFKGFLESMDAAYAGDRAKFDRIWQDIKDECDKADRLLS